MPAETVSHRETLTDHFRRIAREVKSGVLQARRAGESWKFFCLLGEIRAMTASPVPADGAPSEARALLKKVAVDLALDSRTQCLFTEVEENPPEASWLVSLPVDEVLVEIGRALPDPSAWLEAWTASGERFICSDAPAIERASALLSPNEMFLLSRFDAPMSLAELLAISPFPIDLTVRCFYIFDLLGMVEVSTDKSADLSARLHKKEIVLPTPGSRKAQPAGATPPVADRMDWLTLRREIEERSYLITHGTYYDLLNVTRRAGPEEIKNSYYALAKRFHPDLYQATAPPGLHEQLVNLFCHLGEAYETLSDPEKRTAYDRRWSASPRTEAFNSTRAQPASQEQIAQESFARGEELFQRQEFAKALPYLREAVRLKPGLLKFRALLARALSEIPQHRREAEEEFRKSIELDPENAESYVALGHFYKSINLPSRAQKFFLQALEHDPSQRQALKELGRDSAKSKTDKTLGHRLKKFFSKK